MKNKKYFIITCSLLLLVSGYLVFTRYDSSWQYDVGDVVDEFNGVEVYYNGGVNHVSSRHLTEGGYNLGLSYQCVEFVKRYYYEYYAHQMPDSYGHAKSFYDASLASGDINVKRGLVQYKNGAEKIPKEGDIAVYKPTIFNRYGHVSIISAVNEAEGTVEVIQQNAGPYQPSRTVYRLINKDGSYQIDNKRIFGWLRFEQT